MNWNHLAMLARDGLFIKDGRGWYTSATGRAHTLPWPASSTLRGALRTAWGLWYQRHHNISFSPQDWLAKTGTIQIGAALPLLRILDAAWSCAQRIWPAPADAMYAEGESNVVRLDPTPPVSNVTSLSHANEPALESLWRPKPPGKAKPETAPTWWRENDMIAWLCAETVARLDENMRQILHPAERTQIHVTINPLTQTASESLLFSINVLEFLAAAGREWAVAMQYTFPGEVGEQAVFESPLPVAGDRRIVHGRELPAEVFEMPAALTEAFDDAPPKGLRLFVVNPAHFARGWMPDGFTIRLSDQSIRGNLPGIAEELHLRAAIVGRPLHISGWNMAANNGRGQPKPTRRLVPPGSVYFFTKSNDDTFAASEAKALWLKQLGNDVEDGHGTVIPGIWNP